MDKNSKFMTAITASLLALGNVAYAQTSETPAPSKTSKPDDSWKKDPEVGRNAEQIMQELETEQSAAMTVDQVANLFSQFTKDQVQKALDRLRYDGKVRRLGDGSKGDPYRYYIAPSHHE